jgi:hypothetical protein
MPTLTEQVNSAVASLQTELTETQSLNGKLDQFINGGPTGTVTTTGGTFPCLNKMVADFLAKNYAGGEYAESTFYAGGKMVYYSNALYLATQDFTSSSTGNAANSLAADVASGDLDLIFNFQPSVDAAAASAAAALTSENNAAASAAAAAASTAFVTLDNVTLETSGGATQVKDGGVTPAKLSSGGPTWNTSGSHALPSNGTNGGVGLEINNGVSGNGPAYVDFHSTDATNPDYDARIIKHTGSNSDFVFENAGTGNTVFSQNGSERMRISNNGQVKVVGDILIDNGGSDGGQLLLASAGYDTVQIDNLNGNFRVVNTTDATEYMRIDSSGRLLLGSTNYGNGLYDGNSFKYNNTGGIRLSKNTTNPSNQITFHNPNGQVGFINSDGNSTVYSTSSDYRLKEDIVEIDGGIDRLKSLKPCNFRWISDGTRVDGFLAHEAQEVVPEAVTGTKDAMTTEDYEVVPAVLDEEGNEVTPAEMGTREVPDYQGIDQAKLVPLLTKALQEAVAKIEALEARVEQLENA